jgi:hypothetical protein
VAVDQSRHGAEPATVLLFDVAVERGEVPHPPYAGDVAVLGQDVCILDDV